MNSKFEIKIVNDLFILLVDLDKGKSVTNDVRRVINVLKKVIPGGIGVRKIYYKDSFGRFDQIKVKDGTFSGFAPCSKSQQSKMAEMQGGGDCFVCGEYDDYFINGLCRECSNEHGTLIL